MSESQEEFTSAVQAVSPERSSSSNSDAAFRHDLAFPRLSDEMLQDSDPTGKRNPSRRAPVCTPMVIETQT